MTVLLAALVLIPERGRSVLIVPMGGASKPTISRVVAALRARYAMDFEVMAPIAMPENAYYPPRKRWRAEKLLVRLSKRPAWRVMGVADKDISTTLHGHPDWGIMGLADCPGRSCVVSSFRAKQGVGCVAIHELGHTLGLPHCATKTCIMRDAEGTGRIAKSKGDFCQRCAGTIRQWLR
ncbi:MAG: matrixin family metalloprotease [Fimbriimonas sp.]